MVEERKVERRNGLYNCFCMIHINTVASSRSNLRRIRNDSSVYVQYAHASSFFFLDL